MKVILLHDVPKIGKKHEVKEVSAGYARNFLIPRKFAQIATAGALKQSEIARKSVEEQQKIREDLIAKSVQGLKNVVITLQEKSNEHGHLFAGIHKDELAVRIKEETRLDIGGEHVFLDKPIKELGTYQVEVGVGDKRTTIQIIVEEKKEEEKKDDK